VLGLGMAEDEMEVLFL